MSINQERINYIKSHQDLSASQIIDNWKGSDLAIRRKDGFKLIRQERHIKPLPNRKKYTPKKYVFPVIEPPKRRIIQKEGQPTIELPAYPEKHGYYVAKIKVKRGADKGKKYFVAFQHNEDFIEQRDKILSSYGHNYRDISVTFHGFHGYKPFISPDFLVIND